MTVTYNVNIVGNLVNTNGVLSNFSASNYATLPQNFNPGSSSWEMQFKFTTDNDFNQERCIFSQARASDWEGIKIDRDTDHTWISLPGLSRSITGSFIYDYNKTYWLRLSYDGNGTYKLQISEDGVNWILDVQRDNENEIDYMDVNACLGWISPDPNRYWKNTIDLNECYIKINGQIFWEGVTVPVSTPKIGANDIEKIYLGSEEINKIYLGTEVVYEAEAAPPTPVGPVFNLKPNYYNIISGNESDFFAGNSSIAVSRTNGGNPGLCIICDDWSKVGSMTATSSSAFNTRSYGYYDVNGDWYGLTNDSAAVVFSNNNYTLTFNLTDTIRNRIFRTYFDCGLAGTSATYSAFSYTDA